MASIGGERSYDEESSRLQQALCHRTDLVFVPGEFSRGSRASTTSRKNSRTSVSAARAHGRNVTGVAFSPDSKLLASAGIDGLLKIWDLPEGRALQNINVVESLFSNNLPSDTECEMSVAFGPDGKHLEVACGSILVLSEFGGSSRYIRADLAFEPHARWLATINDLAFEPHAGWLATAANYGVALWDAHDGHMIRFLDGHSDRVLAVAISPDGTRVASGGLDGMVIVWEASTGRKMRVLKGHSDSIRALAFNPNGRALASGSADSPDLGYRLGNSQQNSGYAQRSRWGVIQSRRAIPRFGRCRLRSATLGRCRRRGCPKFSDATFPRLQGGSSHAGQAMEND